MPTDNAPIVPRPKHYERTTGAFWLSRNSRIVAGESPACRAPALRLQVLIAERTGLKLPLADGSPPAAITPVIRLRRTSSRFDRTTRAEGYRTTIRPDAVEIEAATREGFFHGIHSLAAMLERDGNLWRLAAGHLRDWPDFSWRGFLVDPARRFIRLERIR